MASNTLTETRPMPDKASPRRATDSARDALHRRRSLHGKLYQFHGFRLLDFTGRSVGAVDWIWADEAGDTGQFIGVHLRWLRGTARVIPVRDLWIDRASRTIRVPYTRDQIKRAPRHAIDRRLTAEAKRAIDCHYRLARPFFPSVSAPEKVVA